MTNYSGLVRAQAEALSIDERNARLAFLTRTIIGLPAERQKDAKLLEAISLALKDAAALDGVFRRASEIMAEEEKKRADEIAKKTEDAGKKSEDAAKKPNPTSGTKTTTTTTTTEKSVETK